MYEDSYLDSLYEDRFESNFDGLGYDAYDAEDAYWADEYEDEDRGVDDDFPMSLEYDGPYGLSGFDEY